jgi:hypothetical protein
MVHLGFFRFLQTAYIERRFDSDSIRRTRPEQQLERPCEFSSVKRFRFLTGDFHRPPVAQISSPWSQKAAALLIDLSIVDIRRVGTHPSEYSSWGVPSKNIRVVRPSRASVTHAQIQGAQV